VAQALASPSWRPPVDLSPPGEEAFAPQIAVDPAGEAVAVWEHPEGSPQNFIAIRTAGKVAGGAWSAPVGLSLANGYNRFPEVAIDDGGDAVAVWQHDNGPSSVIQTASRPAGGAWSAPAGLSLPVSDVGDSQVVVDPAGDAVAIWTIFNGANYIIQTASRPAGGAWSAPVGLSSAGQNAGGVRAAINGSGDVVATWIRFDGPDDIVQTASRPAGGAWSAPVDLSSASEQGEGAQIAVDGSGGAVAVWRSFDGEHFNVQTASRPAGGGAWSAPAYLSEVGEEEESREPQVVVDPAGNATAVWNHYDGEEFIIQSASRPSGGAWGATVDLSSPGGAFIEDSSWPQIAIDPAGDAMAVWVLYRAEDRHGGGDFLVQAARKPAGEDWEGRVDISIPNERAGEPQIAYGPAGNALASWDGSVEEGPSFARTAEFGPEAVSQLRVKKTGIGSGPVTSTPAGIDCHATCVASFGAATEVTLAATLGPGTKAVTWTGCDSIVGANECKVAMSAAREVTADFNGLLCSGTDITGAGATLQGIAQSEAWAPDFEAEACPGSPGVSYESIGSGAGMKAWNFDGAAGSLDTGLAFIGTDAAPTATQISNIKSTTTGAQLAVIPVAQTAIAILANPPAGCSVEAITNTDLAAVMEGRIASWSKLESAEGGCNSPITRVVRKDASGTTGQLKNYLYQLYKKGLFCTTGGTEGKMSWQELEPIGSSGAPNTSWPESCAGKALSAIARPSASGGAAEVEKVNSTAGSIGYASLPEAEAGIGGVTTILELQDNGQKKGGEAAFAEPAAAGAGANCAATTYKVPVLNGRRDIDWSGVFGAKPAIGGGSYPLCALTYDLAFHGYGAAGFTEGQEQTARDYLYGYVVRPAGQAAIASGHYYSALPASAEDAFDVLGAAGRAAASISY
jgi:ABC-type phosphate transport system substrate-binding protein